MPPDWGNYDRPPTPEEEALEALEYWESRCLDAEKELAKLQLIVEPKAVRASPPAPVPKKGRFIVLEEYVIGAEYDTIEEAEQVARDGSGDHVFIAELIGEAKLVVTRFN